MISNYEFLLFKRFFLSRKNEGYISIISWFSLIGISLGVAVLIIVMSVMNGFRDELVNRIIGINGHVNIFSTNNVINDEEILLFKNDKNISEFIINPIIETQGLVIANDKSRGIYIRGMNPDDLILKKDFNSKIKYGKIYTNNKNELIIGENLARYLKVKVKDKIKIAIPKSDKTILGNIPRFKTLTVSGIFNLGMYDLDSYFIYVPYEVSRKLNLLNSNEYNNIEIFIDKPEYVENFIFLIKNFLKENNLDHLFYTTWKDNNKSFLDALKIERNVMFLILILIIIIASMNIISGLIIFVKDKNIDIGILRTIGISKISLVKIFIIIGSTIGLIGTILGTIIGILFSKNIKNIQKLIENLFDINLFPPEIYFLTSLPSRINYWEVIFIVFLSLFLTVLSTIYPAIKSAKIDPIKVIRNE